MEMYEHFAKDLGLSPRSLRHIGLSAPYRYKVFNIPKRQKNEYREIAQPTPVIKKLQRSLVKFLETRLPVHEAAVAYRKGIGIRENAERHSASTYLLKADFTDFFPSITGDDVLYHLLKHGNEYITEEEARVAVNLACMLYKDNKLRLTIGAPSSPFLSNTCLIEFDEIISAAASEHSIVYTRYADDITLSANNAKTVSRMANDLRDSVNALDRPKLRINEDKWAFLSKADQRRVTGLIIDNDGRVSIGRNRKRWLRSALHHFKLGKLGNEEVQSLRGWISFVNDVEPSLIQRFERVYGARLLEELRMS